MTLFTRLTLSLHSFSRILAQRLKAGLICSLSRLEVGASPSKMAVRVGAFCSNSLHTVSHVKCSSAVLFLSQRIESCESEHTHFVSAQTVWHIAVTSSVHKVKLFTAAFAIDLRFPQPTYLSNFFSDCVK